MFILAVKKKKTEEVVAGKKEMVVNQKKYAEPKATSTGSKFSGMLLVDLENIKIAIIIEN